MRMRTSQVSVELGENSSVLSPAWQTSGIATGSQALSGTEGLSFWLGEPSTAVDAFVYRLEVIEVDQIDPTSLLNEDVGLRESIENAREEMKKGGPYLIHDEVFGS